MISTTTRPYSEGENKELLGQLPSRYKKIETLVMNTVFILMLVLLPFLLIDKYLHFSSNIQLITCVIFLIISVIVSKKVTRRQLGLGNAKSLGNVNSGQAEISHVIATRVIERADPEDFGVAYYFEVSDKGEPKLLYL